MAAVVQEISAKGGRHCPTGIITTCQEDTRVRSSNGVVFSNDNHHNEKENDEIRALAGSMTMTSTASTLDLLQPSAPRRPYEEKEVDVTHKTRKLKKSEILVVVGL
jgi:hypothetical protein